MKQARWLKPALTAGACAAIGAAAGIAGSAAAPGDSHKTSGPVKLAAPAGAVTFKFGRAGGPPVHGTEVVPNQAGTGFDTVTTDSGTATAVSGERLTIKEGTDKATYATPTLTIPAGATIERDFKTVKLTDIKVGDHVDVSSSSDGTTHVFAVDPQHWPPKPPNAMGLTVGKDGGPPPGPPGVAGVAFGFKAP
jgi:hypothetical protein